MHRRICIVSALAIATLLFTLAGCGQRPRALKWDMDPNIKPYAFEWNALDDPYLVELRETFKLDSITFGCKSDLEIVFAVVHWTQDLWEHSGVNLPQKNDPINILKKVYNGERFSCLEYSSVAAGCLNALGIRTRVISLMPEDVETRRIGPTHVIIESYLRDSQKWIMADPMRGVIPVLDGKPLNAVQLQIAMAQNKNKLDIMTRTNVIKKEYFKYIAPYLFYFEILFDNRISGTEDTPRHRGAVLLVPVGEKWPRYFNGIPMAREEYTTSIPSVYQRPDK